MKALVLAVALAATAVPGAQEPQWQVRGCDHGHGYAQARRGLVAVMRSPAPMSRRRGARAHHFATCTITSGQARRLHRYASRLRRWRRSYPVVWEMREARLSPGIRATLARLRGCETRGIEFPQNYRYAGHHDGAYQYLSSTWQRAQAYYARVTGERVVGWTSTAYAASPAHQDVVTAYFFPAHRGEWACSA